MPSGDPEVPTPEVHPFDANHYEWSGALNDANRVVFDGEPLRSLQRRAINASMSGKDVLLIMPTGGGKSRCFQLPALAVEGVTVVVVPLLALMHD